jgi:ABC-type taurine transport system ATPase subunit
MNYLILLIAGLLLTVGASAGVGILMLGGLVLLAIGVGRVIARHKVNAARRAEQDEIRAWQLQQIRADQPAEPDWRYGPPHGWPHNQ